MTIRFAPITKLIPALLVLAVFLIGGCSPGGGQPQETTSKNLLRTISCNICRVSGKR